MRPLIRWALGLTCASLSSLLSATGFIMQRKAHLRRAQDLPFQRLMIAGIVIYVSAAAPDVLSYTLVPEVVCSTFACLRLVVVAAFAHFFLEERVQRREVWGMVACTAGTALCVFFGPRPRKHPSMDDTHWVTAYCSITLVVLTALLVLDRAGDLIPRCSGKRAQQVHFIALPLATGLAYSLEKVFNTMLGFVRHPQSFPWGLIEEFKWTLLMVAVATLGLTDLYLNMRGARLMRVQVFVSASFALATTLQYVQSAVIFEELRHLSASSAVLSIFGAVTSLAGALLVRPRETPQDGEGARPPDTELMSCQRGSQALCAAGGACSSA